jgi:hypothetical protein
VLVPFDAPNWVTNTATITATSDNSGGQVSSELTTWTGGTWDGVSRWFGQKKYVGCRFDTNYMSTQGGRIDGGDVGFVRGRFGTTQIAQPVIYDRRVDYNHSTPLRIDGGDVGAVRGRFGQLCPEQP